MTADRQNDTTCPYCGYDFGSEERLDEHVPCPEDKGDRDDA